MQSRRSHNISQMGCVLIFHTLQGIVLFGCIIFYTMKIQERSCLLDGTIPNLPDVRYIYCIGHCIFYEIRK